MPREKTYLRGKASTSKEVHGGRNKKGLFKRDFFLGKKDLPGIIDLHFGKKKREVLLAREKGKDPGQKKERKGFPLIAGKKKSHLRRGGRKNYPKKKA